MKKTIKFLLLQSYFHFLCSVLSYKMYFRKWKTLSNSNSTASETHVFYYFKENFCLGSKPLKLEVWNNIAPINSNLYYWKTSIIRINPPSLQLRFIQIRLYSVFLRITLVIKGYNCSTTRKMTSFFFDTAEKLENENLVSCKLIYT